MPCEIVLTQGKVALVDDADFEMLSQWKWCVSMGYALRGCRIGSKQFRFLMHRVITAAPKGVGVDHIDRNRLNNCRSNLRLVSQGVNVQNTTRVGKSMYRGVHFHANGYTAYINFENKRNHLGRFKKPEEAARAYDEAALRLYGPQAYLNFRLNGACNAE